MLGSSCLSYVMQVMRRRFRSDHCVGDTTDTVQRLNSSFTGRHDGRRWLKRNRQSLCVLMLLRTLCTAAAFLRTTGSHALVKSTRIYYNSIDNHGAQDPQFDRHADELDRRLQKMRARFLNQEYQRPPNPAFTHTEFVTEVLKALWHNYDPFPDSGFRLLVRVSTKQWRDKIFESVGAPPTASEEKVAAALAEAMGRPNNQYAILVGEGEEYVVSFPSEPIDYGDGACWIECRLRSKKDGQLFVVTGWSLERRKADGAWLVDAIDWQDFRDAFRPGIGREEWHRICG